MNSLKNVVYSLTCLLFSIILGAGVYEHFAVWPRAFAGPPASLAMFQGQYGLNPQAFWPLVHPITLLLFVITLITAWRSPRRTNVLASFIGYVVLVIATAFYFVPELMAISGTEFSTVIDEELTRRAQLWERLSLVRLSVLILLVSIMYLGLTKSVEARRR